jgi:hypothetical protein
VINWRYTDDDWAMIQELAGQLGIAERVRRESPHANRDLILQRLGYAASWGIENGLVRSWFTTCRRCGAVVPLVEAEEDQLAPLDQHTLWHAQVEGTTPDGRKVDL